ncbi:MAG: hypothetical protein ACI9P3_006816, partial [Bradyrhizobium sp.]
PLSRSSSNSVVMGPGFRQDDGRGEDALTLITLTNP